jgi:REP element-mobilizing transposase RayT
MASTYLSLHVHIVFGTKDRIPIIHESWRSQLHEYLGGIAKGLGAVPEKIGGVADHVHLLVRLKSTHCLSDFVRELKKASTSWIHEQTPIGKKFAWQSGYAAFTVSATSVEAVRDYIARQEEHHRVKSFREEFVGMLEKAGIDYDPAHLE